MHSTEKSDPVFANMFSILKFWCRASKRRSWCIFSPKIDRMKHCFVAEFWHAIYLDLSFFVTSLLKKLVSIFSKSHVQLPKIHLKQRQWHAWWIIPFANVCSIYILKLSQNNPYVKTKTNLLLTKWISSNLFKASWYFQNVNWTNVWYLMVIFNHMGSSITDTV